MSKRVIIALIVCGAVPLLGTASCGDNSGVGPDGSLDGTLDNNLPPGDGGGSDSPFNNPDAPLATDASDGGVADSGCWTNCNGDGGSTCLNLGQTCKLAADCCSGNCLGGSCQPPPCLADNASCSSSATCCSKTCGSNGTCTPLNLTCATLGNPCSLGADCCSSFCKAGVCAQPSYCGQDGDICASALDCCGGICNIAQGATYGTCAQPPQGPAKCSQLDGVVCQATTSDGGIIYNDAGLPTCGGSCCSRDCAPWGPTGVPICQPASGCHPIGDTCYKNADCCGGLVPGNTNGATVCNIATPGQPGTCGNPNQCTPSGDVCKLNGTSCMAASECCVGGSTSTPGATNCRQDSLGIPRCIGEADGGCVPSSGTCASSADCCNLNPCVPDADGGLTCYPSACVPTSGPCTSSADCCVGGFCYIQSGQTSGSCQPLTPPPDAGTDAATDAATEASAPCALYGQTCSVDGDCCNGVPCLNGRCNYPVF